MTLRRDRLCALFVIKVNLDCMVAQERCDNQANEVSCGSKRKSRRSCQSGFSVRSRLVTGFRCELPHLEPFLCRVQSFAVLLERGQVAPMDNLVSAWWITRERLLIAGERAIGKANFWFGDVLNWTIRVETSFIFSEKALFFFLTSLLTSLVFL